MKIFWWILWTILAIYMWIWIINNSFKNKKYKFKTVFLIFLISAITVIFLYFYKDILEKFGLWNLLLPENITAKTIFSFIFYCVSFLVLIALFLWNIKKKSSINFIVVALLLFIWIWVGWVLVWINTMLIYYLVSCYAEEILKFSTWENVLQAYEKKESVEKKNFWNLIFFAILSWLWFSAVENILYVIMLSIWWDTSTIILFSRSIFTTLLHIVATWLIAFFLIKKDKNKLKYWLRCLIWILAWFGLHALYNLSLNYGYKLLTILIIVVCYFILTYLLINSDLIYKDNSK